MPHEIECYLNVSWASIPCEVTDYPEISLGTLPKLFVSYIARPTYTARSYINFFDDN